MIRCLHLLPVVAVKSSLSTSSCKFLAVIASTFDRFLRRFPSELGCAPGKLITPPELGVDEEFSSEALDDAELVPDGLDSLEGFGVP